MDELSAHREPYEYMFSDFYDFGSFVMALVSPRTS